MPPSEAFAPGSIGKNRPLSRNCSLSSLRVMPACTTQSRSSAWTVTSLFMSRKSIDTPPCGAMTWPSSEEPVTNGMIGILCREHQRHDDEDGGLAADPQHCPHGFPVTRNDPAQRGPGRRNGARHLATPRQDENNRAASGVPDFVKNWLTQEPGCGLFFARGPLGGRFPAEKVPEQRGEHAGHLMRLEGNRPAHAHDDEADARHPLAG